MLILVGSVVLAGGNPNPSESSTMAIVKSGDVVKVFYKNAETAKVKITIYDEDNKSVFAEEVKSRNGFIRPYNLADLPEGEYRVVMQDENEKREESISTIHDAVTVNERALAGFVKLSKDKLLVTLFSKSENDLRVTLFDNNRNILLSEHYNVNGEASKLFSLKNVSGAVVVEVTDKDGLIKSTTM